MRAIRSACLAAMLMASPAWAVEPKAAISGPTTVKLSEGTSVLLDASGSASDDDKPLQWHPFEDDASPLLRVFSTVDEKGAVLDRNAVLAFTPRQPGVYRFALLAQGTVDGKVRSKFVTHSVVVLDDAPQPDPIVPPPTPPTPPPVPPTPPPVVPPAPPAPSPWAAGIQAAFTRVDQPQPHKLLVAAALARAARDTASRADLDTVPTFLKAHRVAVASCLTNNYDAWMPVLEAIKARLDKGNADGTVLTLAQYRAAWVQIAEALEAAR